MGILDTARQVEETHLSNITEQIPSQVNTTTTTKEEPKEKKPLELNITGPLSVFYCKALQSLFNKEKTPEDDKNDNISTESQANDELLRRMINATTEEDFIKRQAIDPTLKVDYSVFAISNIKSAYNLNKAISDIKEIKEDTPLVVAFENLIPNDNSGMLDIYCRENNIPVFYSTESLYKWVRHK